MSLEGKKDQKLLELNRPDPEWSSLLLGNRSHFVRQPSVSDKGIYIAIENVEELLHCLLPEDEKQLVCFGLDSLPPLFSDSEVCLDRTHENWSAYLDKLSETPALWIIPSVDPRDGFVFDHNFCRSLFQDIEAQRPNDHVAILDTYGNYVWDRHEVPLQFRKLPFNNLHWVVRLSDLGADEGEKLWLRSPHPERDLARLPKKMEQSSDALLSILYERDMKKSIMYLRRSVQAKRRFRRSADAIRSLVKKKAILMPHWPQSGIWFSMQFNSQFIESTEMLEKQALNEGLQLKWHHPSRRMSLCVAQSTKNFAKAPDRIKAWFEHLANSVSSID